MLLSTDAQQPTDLGAVSRRGAERHQRHHPGPVGAIAAGEPVQNRAAVHQRQRQAEDDHQEEGEPQHQVPGQGHDDGGSPPAAVAEPGQKQRGDDRHQADDEVVGHVEVRYGFLLARLSGHVRVAGVGRPVLHHHPQGRVVQTAAQLLEHYDGLHLSEHREGSLTQSS